LSTFVRVKPFGTFDITSFEVYIQDLGIYALQPDDGVNPIASIMIAVLAEMANIERSNIVYHLNSRRQSYVGNGGKLVWKVGRLKFEE